MSRRSSVKSARKQTQRTPAKDRYEATLVVSPDLAQGDFTTLQTAINAMPSTGGKIFVKAGVYPLSSTIKVAAGNIHIQGEGMGITVFVANSSMTGNTPAFEAVDPTFGT